MPGSYRISIIAQIPPSNMTSVTEMGGIVFPPVPSFYHRPQSIADLVDHTVSRVVDLLGFPQVHAPRWGGLEIHGLP